MSKNAQADIKQLRAIGHKLKPVVTVAAKGLSDAVLSEIERALSDHELIKVKLAVGDREARSAIGQEICERCGARQIQAIGNIVLLLRPTREPDPRKSNLLRTL